MHENVYVRARFMLFDHVTLSIGLGAWGSFCSPRLCACAFLDDAGIQIILELQYCTEQEVIDELKIFAVE